jgi:demethylmenaquinone methyltransferase / 2-methoxy-6-polyprenyl-1,4-benzoquinol methylase
LLSLPGARRAPHHSFPHLSPGDQSGPIAAKQGTILLTQPHPVLPAHYATRPEREGFVRALFDQTAADYDRINAIMALGSGGWFRRKNRRQHGLQPGARVLDVAIGTGLVAREARALVGDAGLVVGLDASFGMLAVAQTRLALPLVQGRAEALPFPDGRFDMVTIGYALRHMEDLGATFAEFRRVLRPGGALLILEIARPESRFARGFAALWLGRAVPALCRVLMRGRRSEELMRYYWDTIRECVPAETILAELAGAGFTQVGDTLALGLFRQYSGMRAPHAA